MSEDTKLMIDVGTKIFSYFWPVLAIFVIGNVWIWIDEKRSK
jgi:hypothetical protein